MLSRIGPLSPCSRTSASTCAKSYISFRLRRRRSERTSLRISHRSSAALGSNPARAISYSTITISAVPVQQGR